MGAAISRLQRLWEQPSRGSRGSRGPSGSNLSFIEFSRAWRPLGELSQRLREARGGFRRLRDGSRGLPGGFEWLRERSEVASGRVKWLRVASRALEEPPEPTGTQRELSQGNSEVLSKASSIGLVLLYLFIYCASTFIYSILFVGILFFF